jgi:hypothetical protein
MEHIAAPGPKQGLGLGLSDVPIRQRFFEDGPDSG